MEIKPIARFRAPFPEKFGIPRQAGVVPSLEGRIELLPPYDDPQALRGLEGFDYLWLIWGFSANPSAPEDEPFRATVRPPRLGGNERIGVFASRSPFRPNGLGLSAVRIRQVGPGAVILVEGADLMASWTRRGGSRSRGSFRKRSGKRPCGTVCRSGPSTP